MKQVNKTVVILLFFVFIVAGFLLVQHLVSDNSGYGEKGDETGSSKQEMQTEESDLQGLGQQSSEQEKEDAASEESDQDMESTEQEAQEFYGKEIDEDISARITGKSYRENPNISLQDLRYLHLLYYGFDEKSHEGEMIVNQKIADKVLDIFRKLYEQKYQIEQMVLVDEYNADDEDSMEHDNTSAFNYRTIAGSTKLSNHSYGLAIDLNPLYNPAVWNDQKQNQVIQPSTAAAYADRTVSFAHKIDHSDLAYRLFTEAGFTWGGDYKNKKDYQHFEYLESK